MKDKIFVWIKRPVEPPRHVCISNTLEDLQRNVEGRIETMTYCEDLVIICNEEGLINDLPFNCELCGHYFFGNIIIAGVKGDEFADCPLKTTAGMKEMFPQLWEGKS